MTNVIQMVAGLLNTISPILAHCAGRHTRNITAADPESPMRIRYGLIAFGLGLTLFIGTKACRFLAIDKCLDNGGRWDYALNRCEH
jgi:hypothetical protein